MFCAPCRAGATWHQKLRFGHVELPPELFQAIQEYMLSDDESTQTSVPSQTRLMLP